MCAELKPEPHEFVLNKNSSSAFNSTDIHQVRREPNGDAVPRETRAPNCDGLWQILRNLDVDTLVVVGGATDMCVLTTSLDAGDRGCAISFQLCCHTIAAA